MIRTSPGGTRLAYAVQCLALDNAPIAVVNADGSGRREVGFGRAGPAPRWSPDGRQLAYGADWQTHSRVLVATVDSGEYETLWRSATGRSGASRLALHTNGHGTREPGLPWP